MNIVTLVLDLRNSGREKYIHYQSFEFLQTQQHKHQILALQKLDYQNPWFKDLSVHFLPVTRRLLVQVYILFWLLFKRTQLVLLHDAHLIHHLSLAKKFIPRLKVHCVLHEHLRGPIPTFDGHSPDSYLRELEQHHINLTFKNPLHLIDKFFSVSQAMQTYWRKILKRDNVYFLSPPALRIANIPESTPIPNSPVRFVFIARLDANKNPVTALRIFYAYLHEINPQATLTFCGQGPDAELLQAMGQKMGIADKVFFEGFSFELPLSVRQADYVLHLSRAECFSLALYEALHYSKAKLIATDCPFGSREIVAPEVGSEQSLRYPYLNDHGALIRPYTKVSQSADLTQVQLSDVACIEDAMFALKTWSPPAAKINSENFRNKSASPYQNSSAVLTI